MGKIQVCSNLYPPVIGWDHNGRGVYIEIYIYIGKILKNPLFQHNLPKIKLELKSVQIA